MNELHPENGFVQFLFSNENEDKYYTPQCVAFSFSQYLFYSLRKYHYRYVYILEESRLLCANELSYNEYNTNNDSFLKKWIMPKNAQNEDSQPLLEQWSGKYQNVDCQTAAKKIVDMMQTVNRVAMIVPIAVFKLLTEDKKLIAEMKKISVQNRKDSLCVISCPTDANELMRYFSPNIVLSNDEDFSTENGILGADIYGVSLKNKITNQVSYSFFFDELKAKLHDRMVFWNTLDYEDILGMTRRCFVNEFSIIDRRFCDLEWYAAVMWVWYHFSVFRSLSRIQLRDNPYRRMNVAEQNLKSPKIFEEMAELIDRLQEIYTSPERFLSKWKNEQIKHEQVFLYSQKTNNDTRRITQLIERCCTDQAMTGAKDFELIEVLSPLMKIEQLTARYVVAQNRDNNAEKLFYDLLEQTKKILDNAKISVTQKLVQDGKLVETLYMAITDYYQYIDRYSAVELDNTNGILFQKKGKLYELMLKLARQIAKDEVQMQMVLNEFNDTDNPYQTQQMRERYNLFSDDRDSAERYYERAKDCAENLERMLNGITHIDMLTTDIRTFLNAKY